MKAIILAAGYGTRLYPLTLNRPKALLDVADKPIVEHLMNRLLPVRDLDHVYLAINGSFASQFEEWLGAYRTGNNDSRSEAISSITIEESGNAGAISSLYYVLKREKVEDDIIVVAADNLFSHDFSTFILFARQKSTPVVAVYHHQSLLRDGYHGVGRLTIKCVVDRLNLVNPDSPAVDVSLAVGAAQVVDVAGGVAAGAAVYRVIVVHLEEVSAAPPHHLLVGNQRAGVLDDPPARFDRLQREES